MTERSNAKDEASSCTSLNAVKAFGRWELQSILLLLIGCKCMMVHHPTPRLHHDLKNAH